jgi:hypothetical protein
MQAACGCGGQKRSRASRLLDLPIRFVLPQGLARGSFARTRAVGVVFVRELAGQLRRSNVVGWPTHYR